MLPPAVVLQAASRRTSLRLIQASLHTFGSNKATSNDDVAACCRPLCAAGSIKARFAVCDLPNYTVGSSNHFQINDVAACCSLQAASRRTLPPLIQASLHNFGSSSRLPLTDLAAYFSPFCIAGSIKAHFAAFDPSKPLPHFPVAFLGSALSVPQYQRQLLPAQQQQQQGAGAGAIALAAGVARGVADGNATVVVSALTGINMSVSAILPLIVGSTAALPCEHSRDR